ncbi:DoxX family membrane protein [Leucobacter viscericola]|uniref:DoxX family membrane protein n=1 Tax=Leucobacter viscericola TaxID=2714935 RepID=A0A6G7XEY6_9MICO|nr:DoxX family membrane protein [Leucobacter viscericola]QIK62938.1 DoxX family membrane protein [Leucobacter viscericola]
MSTSQQDPSFSAKMTRFVDRVEVLAQKAAVPSMRYAIALIMIWFGFPKLFPGSSSAEDLAVNTVDILTFGLVAGDTARVILAALEVGFGIVLLIGRWMPLMLVLILGHMIGTFTPFLFFPDLLWKSPVC